MDRFEHECEATKSWRAREQTSNVDAAFNNDIELWSKSKENVFHLTPFGSSLELCKSDALNAEWECATEAKSAKSNDRRRRSRSLTPQLDSRQYSPLDFLQRTLWSKFATRHLCCTTDSVRSTRRATVRLQVSRARSTAARWQTAS